MEIGEWGLDGWGEDAAERVVPPRVSVGLSMRHQTENARWAEERAGRRADNNEPENSTLAQREEAQRVMDSLVDAGFMGTDHDARLKRRREHQKEKAAEATREHPKKPKQQQHKYPEPEQQPLPRRQERQPPRPQLSSPSPPRQQERQPPRPQPSSPSPPPRKRQHVLPVLDFCFLSVSD